MPPIRLLTPAERAQESRERSLDWTIYSFATSCSFEEHLTLHEHGIKAGEMLEVSRSVLSYYAPYAYDRTFRS